MTDTAKRPLTEEQVDALVHYDAARDNIANLRRLLAESELRAINAVTAEDVAQFAFETARLRADRFEAAFKQSLLEKVTPILPEKAENTAEGLVEVMVDDIAAGTLLDELDIDGHIQSFLEGRTEYDADGFTPTGLEAPF